MRANVPQRMTETVTILHKVGEVWVSQIVEGAWQEKLDRIVGSDGTVQRQSSLRVQIPSDQVVAAALGDYMVRGAFRFRGTTSELVRRLPTGSKKVGAIRDLRGGLSGINDPVLRYASVLVLDAE